MQTWCLLIARETCASSPRSRFAVSPRKVAVPVPQKGTHPPPHEQTETAWAVARHGEGQQKKEKKGNLYLSISFHRFSSQQYQLLFLIFPLVTPLSKSLDLLPQVPKRFILGASLFPLSLKNLLQSHELPLQKHNLRVCGRGHLDCPSSTVSIRLLMGVPLRRHSLSICQQSAPPKPSPWSHR